jgi:hypothetical protein
LGQLGLVDLSDRLGLWHLLSPVYLEFPLVQLDLPGLLRPLGLLRHSFRLRQRNQLRQLLQSHP